MRISTESVICKIEGIKKIIHQQCVPRTEKTPWYQLKNKNQRGLGKYIQMINIIDFVCKFRGKSFMQQNWNDPSFDAAPGNFTA